jgi:hypothetical protein
MPSPLAEFLTISQAAARLGVTPRHLRTECEAGRVPDAARLHTRCWLIPVASLEAVRPPGPPGFPRGGKRGTERGKLRR